MQKICINVARQSNITQFVLVGQALHTTEISHPPIEAKIKFILKTMRPQQETQNT